MNLSTSDMTRAMQAAVRVIQTLSEAVAYSRSNDTDRMRASIEAAEINFETIGISLGRKIEAKECA